MARMTKLRKMREYRGISIEELSKRSGVSFGTIYNYNYGYRHIEDAKLKNVVAIATVLDCKISDILDDEELANKLT